jgi:hypothetical protein
MDRLILNATLGVLRQESFEFRKRLFPGREQNNSGSSACLGSE